MDLFSNLDNFINGIITHLLNITFATKKSHGCVHVFSPGPEEFPDSPVFDGNETAEGAIDDSLTSVRTQPKRAKAKRGAAQYSDDDDLLLSDDEQRKTFVPAKGQKGAAKRLKKLRGLFGLSTQIWENVIDIWRCILHVSYGLHNCCGGVEKESEHFYRQQTVLSVTFQIHKYV